MNSLSDLDVAGRRVLVRVDFNVPLAEDGGRRLFLFLGGTLGNFEPDAAAAMLDEIGALMNPGDALLLGLDRVKDRHTLEAAYDDAAGHTAAFNRNVINVLNRELITKQEQLSEERAKAAKAVEELACAGGGRCRAPRPHR